MKKTRTLILLALIIASMFVASCKQDVSDGVTCMVNGFVYDVESRLPIEGATVSIGNKVGVTNEEGYFVVSGVGAGTYDVGIVKDGYIPGKVAQLTVNPGFFREVRGEDLAYYRNQIIDGVEDETRISVSGDYDVQALADGTVIISSEGVAPQENTIDSIGDATRYSKTILGVALRPAGGMLTGSVKGLSVIANAQNPEGDYYEIPDGTGIAAFYLPTSIIDVDLNLAQIIADIEKDEGAALKKGVMAFRSVVYDGSFTFAGLPNGFYAIVVDPFLVEGDHGIVEIPQSACYHKDEIIDPVMMGDELLTPVISGYGEAGTVYAVFDDALVTEKLELLSIMVVPREYLPIESARDIDIATGDGLALAFSKVLDMTYEDILIEFDTGSEVNNVWTWSNAPLAGTQYVIENDYEYNYSIVYVWNDEFSRDSLVDPPAGKKYAVHYKVSSVEDGDVVNSGHFVDSIYHTDLTLTNLYEYDYYGNIVDGKFAADEPIVLTFDDDYVFPEYAYVEPYLYYVKDAKNVEVECDSYADGNHVVISPELPLLYDQEYFLSFKVFSEEGVVLYSSIDGLADAVALKIVKVKQGGPADCIYFKTAAHQKFNVDKDPITEKYLTNLTLTNFNAEKRTWTGGDKLHPTVLKLYETIGVVFEAPVDEAFALLSWIKNPEDQQEDWEEVSIPVDVEIDDSFVTLSLEDGYSLFPGLTYMLEFMAFDDENQFIIIENFLTTAVAAEDEIKDAKTGLKSFKIEDPELFDSKPAADAQPLSINAKFYWKSEGIHFSTAGVYDIYKIDEDSRYIKSLGAYAEKSAIVYQYDKEFSPTINGLIDVGTNADGDIDELAFGGTVGFMLVSYDELGRLIQSPIIWVEDEVAPELKTVEDVPLQAKAYNMGDKETFHVVAKSNELLKFESDLAPWTGDAQDKVFVDSKVIYGIANLPGNNGETRIEVTVEFLEAVTLTSGTDLTIVITASDTSGNYAEEISVKPE